MYKINLKGDGDENYFFNHSYKNFDLEKIKETSKYFIGTKDFASFTGKQTYKDYKRTVN
jgi:tRNA U38,U39,U40 pseudouridine synthase TruA